MTQELNKVNKFDGMIIDTIGYGTARPGRDGSLSTLWIKTVYELRG